MTKTYPAISMARRARRLSRRRESLVLVCLFMVSALRGAESAGPAVSTVQKAVSDWARIREETVRLESSWDNERQLLQSTLKALQERARSLADEKKALVAKSASDRESLTALTAENKESQAILESAAARLKKLCDQLTELRPMLPPRLSQALELPYRSLASQELSAGERMQFITVILNRWAQFNTTITYDEELLTISGENQSRLFEVIYWGAGQAYAFDRVAGKAYLGAPRAQGWSWEPSPSAAKPVAELIAIYREKSDPRFVEVPAQINHVLPN